MTYLTTDELFEVLRTPVSTLRFWRHVGKGPAYFRVGKRALYDTDALQGWIKALQGGETVESLAGHGKDHDAA